MTRREIDAPARMVVGASRGLGRGIVAGLTGEGTQVIAVARDDAVLSELADEVAGIEPEVADATDPAVAGLLLDRHDPGLVVLVAGARPALRPLPQQTWETFSSNWATDVRMTFQWVREALLRPMRPGGRIIVISSGAALQGSPLSGGYAGAKATQRHIAAYAQEEADRAGLDLSFTTVLPKLTPHTELGRPAVEAYAARSGQTVEDYLSRLGPAVTPDGAGLAIAGLASANADEWAPAYLLTGDGLRPLS